jgi:hypothetical protein
MEQIGGAFLGSGLTFYDGKLVTNIYTDIENSARTIYVDSVNGLDTNDGTNSGKSFKTIYAALCNIKKYVNINISIQLAVGTYTWDQNCENLMNTLVITYYIVFYGTFVTDDTNLVLTRDSKDYTKYTVTKSGSAVTWADNQYNDYFIGLSTSLYGYPVFYNSGNTVHMLGLPANLSASYSLKHTGTILNVTALSSTGTSNYLCRSLGQGSVGGIYFYYININNMAGMPLYIGGYRIKLSLYYCYIVLNMPAYKQALTFSNMQYLYLSHTAIAYKNTTSMGTSWNQAVSFDTNTVININDVYIRYDGSYILQNERGFKFYDQAPRIMLYSIGVKNFPFGISFEDCTIYMSAPTNASSSTAAFKFSNCGCCIYIEDTPMSITLPSYYTGYGMGGALICDNTNYILQRTFPIANFNLIIGRIIGKPVSGFEFKNTGTQYWTTSPLNNNIILGGDRVLSKKPDYKFTYYDVQKNLNIQIDDNTGDYAIYNSVEYNKYLSLTASATTTLTIGDNTQNKAINLSFSAVRGTLEQYNSINILCKSGSTTGLTFYTINTYLGDNVGVTWTVYNNTTTPNLIILSAQVDNSSTNPIILKYDINRKMI